MIVILTITKMTNVLKKNMLNINRKMTNRVINGMIMRMKIITHATNHATNPNVVR